MAERRIQASAELEVTDPMDVLLLKDAINDALRERRYPSTHKIVEVEGFPVNYSLVDTDQARSFGIGFSHGELRYFTTSDGVEVLSVTTLTPDRTSGEEVVVEQPDNNAFIIPVISKVLMPEEDRNKDHSFMFDRSYHETLRYLGSLAGRLGNPELLDIVGWFAKDNEVTRRNLVTKSRKVPLSLGVASLGLAEYIGTIRSSVTYRYNDHIESRVAITSKQTIPILHKDGQLLYTEEVGLSGGFEGGSNIDLEKNPNARFEAIEIGRASVEVSVANLEEPYEVTDRQRLLMNRFMGELSPGDGRSLTTFVNRIQKVVKNLRSPD